MTNIILKNKVNFLSILTIFITYFPILFKHFEQDEWFDYGRNQIYLHETYGFFGGLIKTITSFLPFTQTVNYLNYHFFGVQNLFPALIVLFLILLNSFFWILNLKKFKVPNAVINGSLLFGYLTYISHQSVTWVMPSIATQSSFLFINLSLLFSFLLFETKKIIFTLPILFFSILAISAKANSFFIFAMIPILFLLLSNKKELFKNLSKAFIFTAILFLLAVAYIVIQPSDGKIGAGRFVDAKEKVFVNVFILPTKSISQILFSDTNIILKISEKILTKYYNVKDQNTIETLGVEMVSVAASLIIVIIIILSADKRYFSNRANLFFVIFYFLSFLPYTLDKFSTAKGFLESRYYYLGTFSLGFLLSSYSYGVYKNIVNIKREKIRMLLIFISTILVLLYFFWNIYLVEKSLFKSIELTQKRRDILSFARKEFIINDNKSFILYIDDINYRDKNLSNVTGTFFQTGFIYPFLVFSYNQNKFDKSIFNDAYFWAINFQGVLNRNGYTIGLFYDYNELITYLKNSNFSLEDLYSLTVDYKKSTKQNTNGAVYDILEATYSNTTLILREKVKYDR